MPASFGMASVQNAEKILKPHIHLDSKRNFRSTANNAIRQKSYDAYYFLIRANRKIRNNGNEDLSKLSRKITKGSE